MQDNETLEPSHQLMGTTILQYAPQLEDFRIEQVNSLQTDPNAIFYERGSDPRPYIDIQSTGKTFAALVDTGAMISVIGYTCESELSEWNTILPSQIIVTTIDASAHPARGKIRAEFGFDGMNAMATFVLVKTPRKQFIAGYDFCKTFGIELTINSKKRAELESRKCEIDVLGNTAKQEEIGNDTENQCANTREVSCLHIESTSWQEIMSIKTAQGANDTENDALPAKHTCVSEPHELSANQKFRLNEILKKFPYTSKTGPLNFTTDLEQEINTGDAKPEIHRQYPLSPYIQEEVNKEIEKLIERDIIMRIEYSPWRWPILWVKKKTGGGRICVDARGLNKLTIPDAYPSLNVDSILRNLPKAKFITSIDMTQAFHQILIRPEDRVKTSFAVGNNLYCYKRAIMGFRNSPADLTKLLDRIFRDLHPQVYHYVDDFIIVSETFDEHMAILQEVARRLRAANLTVSNEKSLFCHKKLTFLGYVLSESGLQPNSERIQPILSYKRPETVRDIRRLIGLVNWYRRFIPGVAELLAPLTDLTKGTTKNSQQRIEWTNEIEGTFEKIQSILASEPILAMADYAKPFRIYSDASLTAGSAVLTQLQDGQEKVIYYHSVKFSSTQQNYSATERELLSVLAGVEKFRPWIDGVKFEVVTDHASIKWLQNLKEPHGKLARWAVRLQAFDIKFIHRPGKQMELPDALSRAVALIGLNDWSKTQDRWYRETAKRAQKEPLRNYKYENELLYRIGRFNSQAGDRLWKVCVPEEKIIEVLKERHEQAAHPGTWKTLRLVQNTYYWPTMQRDIYDFVTKCDICRQTKHSNESTKVPVGIYRDPERMGRMISIDLIGPLPAAKYSKHCYATVAIDCFTKYVFTRSSIRATAEDVVELVEKSIIYGYETPEVMITDNGAQFQSKTFENFLQRHKIRRLPTPAYYAQANPVESTNKTIKNMLRAELLQRHAEQRDWASYLAYVTMRLNTTPNTATGFSPHYLVYGHEKAETGDEHRIIMDATPGRTDDGERRELIRDEAAEAQRKQFEQNRKRYNLRAKPRNFQVGDEVFIDNKQLSSAADYYTRKLATKKIPVRISKALGSDTYLIVDRNGKEIGRWHASLIYSR